MDSSSCELVEIFENQDQYFLWISEIDDFSMSLSLQITNGEKVWKGLISISDKPKSREQELNDRFFEMLKKAILFVDYHSYEYSFIHKSHQLQFLIKVSSGYNSCPILYLCCCYIGKDGWYECPLGEVYACCK